ncbi:unnamed protein product [Cuscuta campestris]|uniref:Uncharacterized protein n=1 Tax=Cuscuta campestris TaxID=132261 RepID=A0A484KZ16_9ASTE|nr:unnamed protein product [Cuscuta campestris]
MEFVAGSAMPPTELVAALESSAFVISCAEGRRALESSEPYNSGPLRIRTTAIVGGLSPARARGRSGGRLLGPVTWICSRSTLLTTSDLTRRRESDGQRQCCDIRPEMGGLSTIAVDGCLIPE